MIGRIYNNKSLYSCLRYCLNDKRELSLEKKEALSAQDGFQHKDRAEVLFYNQCYGNATQIAQQMQDVKRLSRKVEKPAMHIILRPAPGDQLSKSAWMQIARACAEEFDVHDHQYVAVMHKDTAQVHVHIVANRVGYDGKATSSSHTHRKMAALCTRLEEDFQLKKVLSPRSFLSKELQKIPRDDHRKKRLKSLIIIALRRSSTLEGFKGHMKEAGYKVLHGIGIAFMDNKKVKTKGSELGFSINTIQEVLMTKQQVMAKWALEPHLDLHSSLSLGSQTRSEPMLTKNMPDKATLSSSLDKAFNQKIATILGLNLDHTEEAVKRQYPLRKKKQLQSSRRKELSLEMDYGLSM